MAPREIALNHVSVHAEDLEESARFYEEWFGMDRLPTPDFGHPVVWLRAGDRQLHLFHLEVEAPKNHHFAVTVDDLSAFYAQARAAGILDREEVREFPGGGFQMYIRDPAGNLVEVDGREVDPAVVGDPVRLGGSPEAKLFL